jgi:hypothetical protein
MKGGSAKAELPGGKIGARALVILHGDGEGSRMKILMGMEDAGDGFQVGGGSGKSHMYLMIRSVEKKWTPLWGAGSLCDVA